MKKAFVVMLLIFLGITATGFFWVKRSYETGDLQKEIIKKALPTTDAAETAVINNALGMEAPRTYLVLFMNNTELRPGGGFLGSYALVRMNKGKPEIIKVEGTETLDNSAQGIGETPLPPLAKYLGIKTWQFRDSNWSPDFPTNARKALAFYKAENGQSAADITGVIAVTPDIFHELLKYTGPVTADGVEFNSENFTEKLEYEVEYGYNQRGVEFKDRKHLLESLSRALMPRLLAAGLTHWSEFTDLVPRMLSERKILLYSTAENEQQFLLAKNWAGEIKKVDGDFLLWTDANLGSLKTDVVIVRMMNYTLQKFPTGTVATAQMKYNNTGGYTWRTSRYHDYVRVFVPKGSKFLSIEGANDSSGGKKGTVDEGDEGSYHWFGAFISIEPGKSGQLTFKYLLPTRVSDQVKSGGYSLFVQKQSGTDKTRLTLDLIFDKNLRTADPPETPDKFGDNKYNLSTDLRTDRAFNIRLTQ